jgi:hypothetical protein
VRGGTVKVGDRVLVKIVAFDSKQKLAVRWEQKLYIAIGQPNGDIPVVTARRENGEGSNRTLHRNLLLPVGLLHDAPPTPVLQKNLKKMILTMIRSGGSVFIRQSKTAFQ